MPRGKYVNHKGRSRHFTSPEEMEEELKKHQKKKNRNKKEGESDSETESEEKSGSEATDSEEESDDEDRKTKGVENLIEIENPNRAPKKAIQKVTVAKEEEKPAKPELSRREREEVEKQRAQVNYQKLHAEGKTEQARADLARLAIIKERRETERLRREAEKKSKEAKSAK